MRTVVKCPGAEGIVVDDGVLDSWREDVDEETGFQETRLVFAAAHVVMRQGYAEIGHSPDEPGDPEEIGAFIDWKGTRAIRSRLDALGFGIAEAMDTAQRFAIGWANAQRLILECGQLRPANGFIAGAGVDHLEEISTTADVVAGVTHQVRFIAKAGGIPIILPVPWLARRGLDEAGYVAVYREIIERAAGPLLIHWLGEQFNPDLAGYFPGESFARVLDVDPEKVKGCKLSLLDADRERAIRTRLLARGQIVLTGDDLHFADLMSGEPANAGGSSHVTLGALRTCLGPHSHALLGILDAVALPAALALRFLAAGEREKFQEIMRPCERLGQHVFRSPTWAYKSGLAFLAWLNGYQENFMLVNHEERSRNFAHLLQAARLASEAGAVENAGLAAGRLEQFIAERI